MFAFRSENVKFESIFSFYETPYLHLIIIDFSMYG